MTMGPAVRKFALTAHIISSVGWLGAVTAFLALAVAGLNDPDAHTARAAYRAMDLTGWNVIVPLCMASLATGLVQSLGTPWGLFRHYWVIAKLFITLVASGLLLLHMRAVSYVAHAAAAMEMAPGDLRRIRIQLVADAGLAVVALLAATGFSVYKPRGLTPYGRQKQWENK
jgi:hypothetical protein